MSDTRHPESSSHEPAVKVVDRRWWVRQAQQPGESPAEEAPPPSLKPTYVEQLEQQLADKDRQLQEVLAKYREAAREFDEARARLRKEMGKDIERGRRVLIVELLEVVDNLELALAAGRQANPDDPLLKGVDLVHSQLLAKLAGFGVVRLDPTGQRFDPARHEAVSTVPTSDPARDHVVCGVVRPGYLLGEDVLRPALVAVSNLQGS